ncbi:MAG: TonB-dependent receptor [Saprospiraceae bacterium]|nr:TonB-dependent receptor [Saprospiraceae bacterium]
MSFVFTGLATAQECNLSLTIQVRDEHADEPLEFAQVFVEETGSVYQTDASGSLQLEHFCPGSYHFRIYHFGCEPIKDFLFLRHDTAITYYLEHHPHALTGVTVEGRKDRSAGAHRQTLQAAEIQRRADQPLARILSDVTGVSSLRNGSAIASPIIHGLWGNRINILQYGVVQAGQQWGADHAPEVDPFAYASVTVVKGAENVLYGGNGLGGAILLEPGPIPDDPHLHGSWQAIYQTNGRSVHTACKLERAASRWRWRITGSARVAGDRSAPAYYLRNTGSRDVGFSAFAYPAVSANWKPKYYYSFVYSGPGILRGSHVSNLTDLEEAIVRDTPFYTSNRFSYAIDAPRQEAFHQLFKASFQKESKGHFNEWQIAGQWNRRREYDVRRGGRSDLPALELDLYAASLNWSRRSEGNYLSLRYGAAVSTRINRANKSTGIIPLIPDYVLIQPGAFIKLSRNGKTTQAEVGLRTDYYYLSTDVLTTTLPRQYLNEVRNYLNISIAAGIEKSIGEHWSLSGQLGWTKRSPQVNELFSMGLHQSVAGIEEGNPSLKPEQSVKIQLGSKLELAESIHLEVVGWQQLITAFIFLEPQPEPRLTIRGAFPVFIYRQTDALLRGLDLSARFEFGKRWMSQVRGSMLDGRERNDRALIYIPPHNLSFELHHFILPKTKLRKLDLYVRVQGELKQSRYPADQDLAPPPPGYVLLDAGIESSLRAFGHKIFLGLSGENLLNTVYRTYLNRLRYFADEPGRSLRFLVKFDF